MTDWVRTDGVQARRLRRALHLTTKGVGTLSDNTVKRIENGDAVGRETLEGYQRLLRARFEHIKPRNLKWQDLPVLDSPLPLKKSAQRQGSLLFLPTFCGHSPSVPHELALYETEPPLIWNREMRRFEFDYFGLFVADRLLIDQRAVAQLRNRDGPYAGATEMMETLFRAELLEEVSFADQIADQLPRLQSKVERLLSEQLPTWLRAGREQWEAWKPIGTGIGQALQGRIALGFQYPFGLYAYLHASGSVSEKDLRHYTRLLESITVRSVQEMPSAELDVLREVVRPYVEHVLISDGLRLRLGQDRSERVRFTDWADMGAYYHAAELALMAERNLGDSEKVRKAQELFQVGLPEFSRLFSATPQELVLYLKDVRARLSLKEEVESAVRNRTSFDEKWLDALRTSAIYARDPKADSTLLFTMLGPQGAQKLEWYYALQRIKANKGQD